MQLSSLYKRAMGRPDVKPFIDTARGALGHGLAVAGAGAAMAGIAQGAEAIFNAATKSRDFNRMLEHHPDLRDRDQKAVTSAFTTVRALNPQYSSQPLIAGAAVKNLLEFPGGAVGIADTLSTAAARSGKLDVHSFALQAASQGARAHQMTQDFSQRESHFGKQHEQKADQFNKQHTQRQEHYEGGQQHDREMRNEDFNNKIDLQGHAQALRTVGEGESGKLKSVQDVYRKQYEHLYNHYINQGLSHDDAHRDAHTQSTQELNAELGHHGLNAVEAVNRIYGTRRP
jgi:hypothetical protein